MKDFRSKVSVKICAWLLFALSALSCCVSVFGIGVLLLSDSYFDGGRKLRYAVASDFFYSIDKKRIDKYTENVLNKVPNIDEYEYDYIFSKENCNIFFTVTDDNGILIIDHGDDAEYCEKFTYDENFYFDGRVIGVNERYFDAKTEAEEYISAMCAEYNVINYTITEIESYEYEQEYASRDNDGISISEKPITEIASNTDNTANVRYKVHIQYDESDFITYHVTAFIRKDFTAKDKYYYFLGATRLLCNIRFEIIFIALACAVLCLFIVVFLCSAAGHKKNKDWNISFGFAQDTARYLSVHMLFWRNMFTARYIVYFGRNIIYIKRIYIRDDLAPCGACMHNDSGFCHSYFCRSSKTR